MSGKIVVAAVGAFGYGVYIGWAVTADSYEKKVEDKAENINVLRSKLTRTESHIAEKLNPFTHPVDGPLEVIQIPNQIPLDLDIEEEKPPEEEPAEEPVTNENEEVDEVETEIVRGHLQHLIDSYTSNQEEIDAFTHRAHNAISMLPPFVISQDKYAFDEDEGDDYDKITVTYYPQYRVILDDGDELMEDVDNIIGWRSLNQFGGESGHPDVVFVRNRRLRTDFEVVKEEDEPLPLHIKYGMGRDEFEVNKAAGVLRLRDEDL